jgi:uncharacterized RDD family membrane protein YckC
MQYTGFFKRAIAAIIDTVLLTVVLSLILGENESLISSIIYFVVWFGYFVFMVGKYGATIGKMVMKIKIVKENGKKVNYTDSFVRELTSYLSFIVLCLGYLWVIWDKRKQGWHDKIAKTVVVKV